MEVIAQYQPTLVALSIVVSVFASYTTLDLAGRLRAAKGNARWLWLCGASVAMGGGIWAMHFIGMLAFIMPMPVAYDPGLTFASLLLPIFVTGAGLALVGRYKPPWPRLSMAGILMGLGIVTMHYVGMAAMVMDAMVVYDPKLIALSVLIAIGASTAALRIASSVTTTGRQALSAVLLGLAVVGMHYTGMTAASFHMIHESAPPWNHLSSLHPELLAIEVGGVAGGLLMLALASSTLDRRWAEQRAQDAQHRLVQERLQAEAVLRESEERYRLAIEATGLGTWDWNVLTGELLWSDRTRALLGVSPYVVPSYEAFLACIRPEDRDTVDTQVRAALDVTGDGTFTAEFQVSPADGETRWIRGQGRVYFEQTESGRQAVRFLGTVLDVTGRRLGEEDLRASLAEKETLLQEVHHRVKNNMQVVTSLLRIEYGRIKDEQARERLTVINQRIQAMARLHEHLYATGDLARIDFGAYLRELVESLMDLNADRPVRVEVEAEPLACALTTAIPLGLIANELVTNSLKHAFPNGRSGTVRVSLTRSDDAIVFEVGDNGVGWNGLSRTGGLGGQITMMLARQLDAALAVDHESGYRTQLTLPADCFTPLDAAASPKLVA